MVDGRFYIIEVTPWSDGHLNRWIYSFKNNSDDDYSLCYVSAYIGTDSISSFHRSHFYVSGRVCSNDDILSLRTATPEEVREFIDAMSNIGYNYNVNTKRGEWN